MLTYHPPPPSPPPQKKKKNNNVCLIGRSSAEWRITSPYLGTSQKAAAPQQCHLVALTETRESNFRLG